MFYLLFFACAGVIYYYVEKRGSFGFFWVAFFLVIMYVAETHFTFPLGIAALITCTTIIAAFEFSRILGVDPFANANVYQFARKSLKPLKALFYSLGLGPKNPLVNNSKDKRIQGIKKMLISGNYDRAESLLLKKTGDARYMILDNIASTGGRPKYIDQWLTSCPNSSMALTLSGLNLINWAWEARGSGLGDTVSAAAAEQFHTRLLRAEAQLNEAAEICKDQPEPYIGLITIAKGTFNRNQIWRYFASAIRLNPSNYYAHTQMIDACAEKWGGSSDEMFKVARQSSFNSEVGSPLKGIIAIAHIEQWLNLEMDGREDEAGQYFFDKKVQSGLKDAYREYGDGAVESTEQVEAFNYFVYSFYMAGLFSEFTDALGRLQGRYTEMPWAYHGEPFLCMFDTGYSVDHVLSSV